MTTRSNAGHRPDGIQRATGRGRAEWFGVLDAWGAAGRPYRDIAAWLTGEQGLSAWWAQKLIVEYEQARGIRGQGARRDGTFTAGASRTVRVSVERLFDAVADAATRARWLPDVALTERTATPPRSLRFDITDGTRLTVTLLPAGPGRARIAAEQERLPEASSAAAARTAWRDRLTRLKELLEPE